MNQTTNINSGWSFCLGDIYDAEKAERVCLPHSVKLTPQNSSGCRNYQGKCVYRKMLFVPDDLKGKKLFLKSTLEVSSFHIYVTNIYVVCSK